MSARGRTSFAIRQSIEGILLTSSFSFSPRTIELSVDLDRTAPELISLLTKASKFQAQWRLPGVPRQMITRYYRFMQLKASMPANILLIPTLDIEMVWQTHLLRPVLYREDCQRLFHRVIDHSLLMENIEQFLKEQAFIDTCKLYEERFGEEYCASPSADRINDEPKPKYVHPIFSSLKCLIPTHSYWDETHFTFPTGSSRSQEDNPFSLTEADLILDGNWLDLCTRFMKEMVAKVEIQGYYHESNTLELTQCAVKRLKKSYERFLYLSTKYPATQGYEFVHPTYAVRLIRHYFSVRTCTWFQIDIMWHSHMQEPLNYAADCLRLMGQVIDHAPWPAVDEEKMKGSCHDTLRSWKREFDVDMATDHLYNTIEGGWED